MEKQKETCPQGDRDLTSDKGVKSEEEEDDQIPGGGMGRTEGKRPADRGDEQAGVRVDCACQPPAKGEDDYGCLFSQYSSTLYSVAMEAVTQSLLSSRHLSSRKKSPAWKHFFISPRDSTKAICTYCMKEFSRGKNEKDLSTSCLMRHVRRAHPTKLLQGDAGLSSGAACPAPQALLPPPPADRGGLGTMPSPIGPGQKTAPKLPSPDRVTEEAVSAVSEEEASSDVSSADKCGRGEALAAPYHHFPLHFEEAAEGAAERSLALPKGLSGSRRRSAVWKHFYLSPLDSSKAVCVHCTNEFSRGKNGKDLGTSCLIRHMWRAHRAIVLQENGGGMSIPPLCPAPPTLLPALLDPNSGTLGPGCPPASSSSPEQLCEGPGNACVVSSSELTKASLVCSPEKPPAGPASPRQEAGAAAAQQGKKVVRRLKSEVWHHFSLAPLDSLKAVCRYCGCVISRGKKGDLGTTCLMRHLYRRHPEVVGSQKDFLGASLANSPYATLASAERASRRTDLPVVPRKSHQAIFPVSSKKTSKLWNHFSVCSADSTKVVCLHCGRTISRGKKPTNLGTSCLLRHLQRFHSHVLEAAGPRPPCGRVPRSVQPSAPSFSDAAENFYDSHPVAKKITSLIAEMIALDLQPYSLVDSVGFSRLLEYLEPQYKLPSPAYFSRTAIPSMYDSVKQVIMSHLKEAESGVVHFTSGIWMSSQTREYLTLTAHWVTFAPSARPHREDHHCSALLDVSQVDCDYGGGGIRRQLQCWWEAWVTSLGLQVGITVTDHPSVGKTLSEGKHSSVQCFSHTVSLIVSEAIKSQRMVQNLLSTARKLCERVQRSARARDKLAELQREYALPPLPLTQDVPARWSTSFHMLERLIEQKRAVNEMALECNLRELISSDQWEVMQSVCHALRPFHTASREMSAPAATLSQVIPMIHILRRKVEMLFGETMGIDTMLKSLKEAIASRLSPTLHDPRCVFATLLDPRYKASLFTEEEVEQYRQDLIRELEILNSTSEDTATSHGCGSGSPSKDCGGEESLWSLMAKVKRRDGREKLPEDMVLAYLEEELLDHSCDPLTYWSLKRASWPGLSTLAVRFLGCPPSTVPSEKLFSTATEAGGSGQPRLVTEHFEKLIFLRVNLPLMHFQY